MKVGLVTVDQEVLLRFLDLVGGNIRNVNLRNDTLGKVVFTIEHEDMPEVMAGGYISDVLLEYTTYVDALGHKVSLRIK